MDDLGHENIILEMVFDIEAELMTLTLAEKKTNEISSDLGIKKK